MKKFVFYLVLCAVVSVWGAGKNPEPVQKDLDIRFVSRCSHPDAFYKKGETAELACKVLENGQIPQDRFVEVTVFVNDQLRSKKITPAQQEAVVRLKLNEPGWVMMKFVLLDRNKQELRKHNAPWFDRYEGGIGAMFAPEEIRPALACPEDFDEFWLLQRAKLDQVPLKAVRAEVPQPKDRPRTVCYDVQVDCAGPRPVSGYLLMPRNAKPKSLPAMVEFHGAGVYSAWKPQDYAEKAIVFNVNAHGIPNGRDAQFYRDLAEGELKDYPQRGKQSRDSFYFLGMYLRVMRALDYVKSLPEWNGRDLIVYGGSQGGAQSIAAAALDRQVTFCMASVPALCDHGGVCAARGSGWPRLYSDLNADNRAVMETAKYFDGCNFARRIQCEIRVATGFIDRVCVPTSVYAFYNSLPETTVKGIYTLPRNGHSMPNPPAAKRMKEILDANTKTPAASFLRSGQKFIGGTWDSRIILAQEKR